MADDDFLRRWSRRKSEARRAPDAAAPQAPAVSAATASQSPAVPAAHDAQGFRAAEPTTGTATANANSNANAAAATPELPDPATLEPGADISAFMARGVDEALRRRALKSLFSDPHFNVMDRLDVYIDDYSIPDPLPPDWLDKLEQVSHLGDRGARDREAEAQAAQAAQAGAPVVGAAPEGNGRAGTEPDSRGASEHANAGRAESGEAEGDAALGEGGGHPATDAAQEGTPAAPAAS